MNGFLSVVVIIAFVFISFAVVTGVSLGLGWLLTLIVPFSLFEGTITSMIAGLTTWMLWRNLLRTIPAPLEDEDFIEDMPTTRFWPTEAERTWENWLRYVFANSIYEDLLTSPRWSESMGDSQLQLMAVHLADVTVENLKRKSPRTRRMKVSGKILKQEMAKSNQRPYDEDVLDIAATAVNMELSYLEDELRSVIKNDLWAEQVDVF